MRMDRREQNRLSAEWAAYGDALGFMTELADLGRVRYRIGSQQVTETVSWRRKIGGYNGASIDLPAGSYSDDTQLRLSTSRAIRSDGTFDVAAFAKVELTAWANYGLGAGAGTKEAASNLARTSATWYSNFFDTKRSVYVRGGGNGAAMRVQPHVWAAKNLSDTAAILLDVIRNSVCTHGHPRGIVGACLHAINLRFAMLEGRPAYLSELKEGLQELRSLPNVVERDGDLRLLWLGAWSQASGVLLDQAVHEVLKEVGEDLNLLASLDGLPLDKAYPRALEVLGATDPASRGSGTKTALLASFAASLADPTDPKTALLTIVNALGSDTDSIATMAGAILGACTDKECEDSIQDRDYIRSEAERLAGIASKLDVGSFRYPDLRSWKPARAAVDAIGLLDGVLWLNGIGSLEPLDHGSMRKVGEDLVGWCRLSFGQTILARFRSEPYEIVSTQARAERKDVGSNVRASTPPAKLQDLFAQNGSKQKTDELRGRVNFKDLSLNEVLLLIVQEGFPPELIGQAMLHQVEAGGKNFVERGIALTANILTAYEARSKRRRD